jgi:FMN-dependent NADH-azoreductase
MIVSIPSPPAILSRSTHMKLLHIDSSILGDNSASRQLSRQVVDAWQAAEPSAVVTYRDLAADAISHFSSTTLVAAGTTAELRDAAQQHEAELSASTLAEFIAADAVVIAAPMYNFTVPTQLKAWIDRVAVAGQTFRYTEAGPEGLCGGKKVVIVSTSGGIHAGQASGIAHEEYLKLVLGFLGITDIEIVRAEGLAYGEEVRNNAMSAAQAKISEQLFAAA